MHCISRVLADEEKPSLLEQAARADSPEKALELATQALKKNPDDTEALLFRGRLHAALRQHKEALADYDRLLKLSPDNANAMYWRGRSRLCAGDVKGSLADFDRYVKLRPQLAPRQWERGIALYYAGRYKEGAEQFELYQTYHDNDVENATWRYLCMAQTVGVEKARRELLPIENDRRVPMMQVYAMFRGEMKPADVLAAARSGNPTDEQLKTRLFYAHLYIGLFHEAEGNAEQARKHIRLAADEHKIGHYMWDVARLHAERLEGREAP